MLDIATFEALSEYPFCKKTGLSVPNKLCLCENGCSVRTWFKQDESPDDFILNLENHDVVTIISSESFQSHDDGVEIWMDDENFIFRDAACSCNCGCGSTNYNCGLLRNYCIYELILTTIYINKKYKDDIFRFNKLIASIDPDIYSDFCNFRKNIILKSFVWKLDNILVNKTTETISGVNFMTRELVYPFTTSHVDWDMLVAQRKFVINLQKINATLKTVKSRIKDPVGFSKEINSTKYVIQFGKSAENFVDPKYSQMIKNIYDDIVSMKNSIDVDKLIDEQIDVIEWMKHDMEKYHIEKKYVLKYGVSGTDYIEVHKTTKIHGIETNDGSYEYDIDFGYYDDNVESAGYNESSLIDSFDCSCVDSYLWIGSKKVHFIIDNDAKRYVNDGFGNKVLYTECCKFHPTILYENYIESNYTFIPNMEMSFRKIRNFITIDDDFFDVVDIDIPRSYKDTFEKKKRQKL